VLAQAGRAWAAWGEVSLHDEEAAERNARLAVWVDDRTRTLLIEMDRASNELVARGQLYSGAHGGELAHLKAQALHDYRDENARARIDLSRLRAREGAWHWLGRKLRRRPAPRLTSQTLGNVDPFLERWREPVTRHESGAGPGAPPLDRTTRTTADALAELPSLKLT
jgi:hypothetical protein